MSPAAPRAMRAIAAFTIAGCLIASLWFALPTDWLLAPAVARGATAATARGATAAAAQSVTPATAQTSASNDPTPLRRILDSPPVLIRAESGLDGVVNAIAAIWPDAARGVAAGVGRIDPAPVEIVVLRGETFRNWAGPLMPEWGIGYARWPAGPIVLDAQALSGGRKTLAEVLRHELSHVYLGQRIDRAGAPRWFVEGVAQAQSGEWRFLDTLSLVRAAGFRQLPRLSRIGSQFPLGGKAADLAYRVSLSAVLDLEDRLAERGGWRRIIDVAAASGRFDTAFEQEVGLTLSAYSEVFDEGMRSRFGWIAAIGQIGSLFTFMTLLFLIGVVRSRWRTRRRLAEMEREESERSSSGG